MAAVGVAELIAAAEVNDWKQLGRLLSKGLTDVNARDPAGYTALHYAVSRLHPTSAQMLIDNGADINAISSTNFKSPLHCACNAGSIELVEMLLANPECIATVNSRTKTSLIRPLHCAAASAGEGCELIADQLLQAGALINARDADGRTALAYACRRGKNLKLVEALLKGGADPNLADKQQITPLHHAAGLANGGFARLLLQYGSNPNTEISVTSPMPPLHLAARIGSFEACQQLLSNGANANQAGNGGRHPIHFAAFGQFPRVVGLLAEHGAQLNVTDLGGHTAIAYAANQGCVESTTLLLALGANPNVATTLEKWTPLHHAARGGHAAVATVLTAHGDTDINARDSEQRTPLHWAVFTEDMPMVIALVNHGANGLFEDSEGLTPGQVAIERGLDEIGDVLETHTGVKRQDLHATGNSLGSYWITNSASPYCIGCGKKFGLSTKRHCCRPCRGVFCSSCLVAKLPAHHTRFPKDKVCQPCFERYEDEESMEKVRSLLGSDGSTAGRSYLREELSGLRDAAIELQGDGGRGYTSKFNSLAPIGMKQSKKASSKNKAKNRYPDILAYDHTRVKLSSEFHRNDNDYINANYIHGNAAKVPMYIAAQGPTPDTTHSFWQMVWEQNTSVIIMVTPLVERGIQKCHQYWPEEDNVGEVYGDFRIVKSGERKFDSYVKRVFRLHRAADKAGAGRPILQYAFLAWPDHGAPRKTKELLDMYWAIKPHLRNLPVYLAADKKNAPGDVPLPVVHCSAGVGRTGTFIALDWIVNAAQCQHHIDIMDMIRRLRSCRNYMVQSVQQFVFIYRLAQDSLQEFANGSERITRGLTTSAIKSKPRSKKGPSETKAKSKSAGKSKALPPVLERGNSQKRNDSNGVSQEILSQSRSYEATTSPDAKNNPFLTSLSPDATPGGFSFNRKDSVMRETPDSPTSRSPSESQSPLIPQSSASLRVSAIDTTSYTVVYMGSQQVKSDSGDVASRTALNKVKARKAKQRKITLKISAEGMELIELGKSSGALFAPAAITDSVALDAKKNKEHFYVTVTVSSRDKLTCHCFDTQGRNVASSIQRHLSSLVLAGAANRPPKTEADLMALALARSVEDQRGGGGSATTNNHLSEEEQLAMAMSASVLESKEIDTPNQEVDQDLKYALSLSVADQRPGNLQDNMQTAPPRVVNRDQAVDGTLSEEEQMALAIKLSMGEAPVEKRQIPSQKLQINPEFMQNNPFAADSDLERALAESTRDIQAQSTAEVDDEMALAMAISSSLAENGLTLAPQISSRMMSAPNSSPAEPMNDGFTIDAGQDNSRGISKGHHRTDSATEVANVWAAAAAVPPQAPTTASDQSVDDAIASQFGSTSEVDDLAVFLERGSDLPSWGIELQYVSAGCANVLGISAGSIAAEHKELVEGSTIYSLNGLENLKDAEFREIITTSKELLIRFRPGQSSSNNLTARSESNESSTDKVAQLQSMLASLGSTSGDQAANGLLLPTIPLQHVEAPNPFLDAAINDTSSSAEDNSNPFLTAVRNASDEVSHKESVNPFFDAGPTSSKFLENDSISQQSSLPTAVENRQDAVVAETSAVLAVDDIPKEIEMAEISSGALDIDHTNKEIVSPSTDKDMMQSNQSRQIDNESAEAASPANRKGIYLGSTVSVPSKGFKGICRFSGSTEFASGHWIGIELSTPTGRHNGAVNGKQYFTCKALHGIFARVTQVALFQPTEPADIESTQQNPAVELSNQNEELNSRATLHVPDKILDNMELNMSESSATTTQDGYLTLSPEPQQQSSTSILSSGQITPASDTAATSFEMLRKLREEFGMDNAD